MGTEPTVPVSPWIPGTHAVRTKRSQRHRAQHKHSVQSDSSQRSSAPYGKGIRNDSSQRLNVPYGKAVREIGQRRETYSAPGRGGINSTRKRDRSADRRKTFSNVTSHPMQGSDAMDEASVDDAEAEEAMKATELWVGSLREQKQAESRSLPPTSPSTALSQAGDERQELEREETGRRFESFRTHHSSLTEGAKSSPGLTFDGFQTDIWDSSEYQDDPDRDPWLQFPESGRADSIHDEIRPKPSLTNTPNRRDIRQGRIEQMKRYAKLDYPRKGHPHYPASNPESPLHVPDSGDGFLDDDSVLVRDFGLWIPSNKQDSDHDLLPQPSVSDHTIGGTAHPEVSDMSREDGETGTSSKTSISSHSNERDGFDSQPQPSESGPNSIDANPIHDPGEGQSDLVTSETKEVPGPTHSPSNVAKEIDDSQVKSPGNDRIKYPQTSGSEPTLVDANPIHGPVDAQFDPEIDQSEVEPHTTNFPGTIEEKSHISQPNSPGSDHIKNPNKQPYPSGSDQLKSSDSRPESPKLGGVSIEMSPTRAPGEVLQEDIGPEAWLNSDAPLSRNYRAIFPDDLRSPNISPGNSAFDDDSDRSASPTFRKDSLIVSPTMPVERDDFEEDQNPSADMTKADLMKLIADYEAKSQLEPSSEEQEARKERRARKAAERQNREFQVWTLEELSNLSSSSDESILVSHTQDDGEVHDAEKVEEVYKVDEAASRIIELEAVNYAMQKDFEAKETKFKQDIKIAWTHPRPPPTTAEQRNDKRALEKIKSKRIFDQVGDQQRPIRTDPRLVVHETEVNVMITRAQMSYLLEDFPKMYMHANQAAAAAGQLKYPPLTARCCYYRGLAQYHYRDFDLARKDFVASRGCAGLYGISSEIIETHIDLIDKADDPESAILQRFPPGRFSEYNGARRGKRITANWEKYADDEDEHSQSSVDDALTLVRDSPTSPRDKASAPSPFTPPNQKERPAEKSREDTNSEIQSLRRPSRRGADPLDSDPQPATDEVPTYQPQEEAISEEIRKDILESKAKSLVSVSGAGPVEVNAAQERRTLAPPSMASTERTVLGSAASQAATRRVLRPYVAPITTSIATEMNNPVKEASPEATPASGDTDLMDVDEIMAAFNTAREDATPNTPDFSDEESGLSGVKVR